jgi:hypothetical protein
VSITARAGVAAVHVVSVLQLRRNPITRRPVTR